MLVLLGELTALYSAYADGAPSPLTAPAPSYLDFVRWQHERLTPAAAAGHLDYWRAQLAGAPPLLELPTDRPRPRTPSFQGAMLSRELGPALTDGVRRLARERDSSPYMVLLAALH